VENSKTSEGSFRDSSAKFVAWFGVTIGKVWQVNSRGFFFVIFRVLNSGFEEQTS
jgi:hypothetical protein